MKTSTLPRGYPTQSSIYGICANAASRKRDPFFDRRKRWEWRPPVEAKTAKAKPTVASALASLGL